MLIWTDNKTGQRFEVKIEEDEPFYRKQGEGDDKWGKGHPPGWIDLTVIPFLETPFKAHSYEDLVSRLRTPKRSEVCVRIHLISSLAI